MKKKLLNTTAKFFKIFIIAILAILLFFSWQLYRNGINLSFVTAIAERALNPDDSEYTISLGNVQFSFVHRAVPIALKVYDVSVFDKSGHKAASIEELTTYLSASALLHGVVAPSEIVLHKPKISMFVDKSGSIGIGFNENKKSNDILSEEQLSLSASDLDNVQMLYNILDFDESAFGRYSYLTKLNVVEGSLFFREDATKTFWFFPKINLNLARVDEDITVDGSLDLLQKNKKMAHIKLDAFAEKNKMRAKAYVMNFILPDRVADFILAETRVTMPLNGEMSMVIDLDKSKPVSSILLRLDELNFSFSGDKGALVLPDPIFARYDVKNFLIEGYAKNGLKDVKLSKITAKTETGASAWGEADIINLDKVVLFDFSENLIMDFNLHAKDITISALKDYWPASLGPATHEWVSENISEGMVESGSFNLVFERNEQGDIEATKTDGTVNIKNATVRYIETLPVITDAKGHLNITKDDVRIIIENGNSLGLKLYFADLYFYDIWEHQEQAKMLIRVKGSLPDALKLLDMPPFGFITDLDVNVKEVEGEANTTLDLAFPLRKDLTVDKVKLDVKADVKAKRFFVEDYSLFDADMSIDVDNRKMLLEGNGVLHNAKTVFSWEEVFKGEKAGSVFNIEMLLDTAARKEFGLNIYPFDENGLDGLTKINMTSKMDRQDNEEITISADLTSAVLRNDIIGLSKDRNIPATVEAKVKRVKEKIKSVPKFSLNAGRKTAITGSVEFDDNGKPAKINLDKLKLQGTDLVAKIAFYDSYADVNVKGAYFNAERLIDSLTKGSGKDNSGGFDTPLQIQAKLDEVWLSEKGNIHNVDLNFFFDKKGQKYGLLTANAVTGQKLKITAGKATNGKTKIVMESDDAGAVLKALDITSNIRGGVMRGYAYMDDDFNLEGKAIVKNFTLVKAETLSQILKIASLTGILGVLQGEGLEFDMSVIPFAYVDNTWQIKEAIASGFSLGLTAEGYLKGEKLNIEGNIVPAYAFNSFLGKIPLLGNLFTSEDGGGLISFKYYIEGQLQEPKITVNPLSALTPGMVRKIFDKNVLDKVSSEKEDK